MRQCEFEVYQKLNGESKWRKYTGMFHRWANQYEEFTEGPGNYTVALIEMDDGTITEAPPDRVKFLDKCPVI